MITDVSPVAVAMTAVINLAFACIAGIAAAKLWLGLTNQLASAQSLNDGMPLGWLAVAGAALVLLLDQAAQLSETAMLASWETAAVLATQTFSGRASASVIVLALAAAVLTWRRSAVIRLALLCFAVATAMRSAMGHAGDNGALSLAVLVEWSHLAAMSLWVGCVIVSGWVVLPALARSRTPSDASGAADLVRRYAARLSTWASAALATIALSGVFNTDRVLERYADLFDTDYGKLLLAKITLVVVALCLGGVNRMWGMPALARDPVDSGLRQFIVILKAEAFVLTAVVILAAILTNVSAYGSGE